MNHSLPVNVLYCPQQFLGYVIDDGPRFPRNVIVADIFAQSVRSSIHYNAVRERSVAFLNGVSSKGGLDGASFSLVSTVPSQDIQNIAVLESCIISYLDFSLVLILVLQELHGQ